MGITRPKKTSTIEKKHSHPKRALSKRIRGLRVKTLKPQTERSKRVPSPLREFKRKKAQMKNLNNRTHPNMEIYTKSEFDVPRKPKHVKLKKRRGLQHRSEKLKSVQLQQEKSESGQRQPQEPKFRQLRPRKPKNYRERSLTPCHEKRKKPGHLLIGPSLSFRSQLQLAIKNSLEDIAPAKVLPTEERMSKRKETKGTGRTYLHTAALKGNYSKVKTYLQQGRNPDIPNNAGWTALHDACLYNRTNVVNLLVNAGADVNALGPNRETPLFDAVTANNLKMVRLLLNHGANPRHKNKNGLEASHFANPTVKECLQMLKVPS